MKVNKCENIKIEAYTTSFDDFMFDIVEDEETYFAFIYRKNYALKTFMFGGPKTLSTKEEFVEMVLAQLVSYAAIYMEDCDRIDGIFDGK